MDELVKRLRDKAGAFDYDGRPDIACDYEQAADAIEELTRENKELSFRSAQLEAMNDALIGETGAADALMVVSQPRWIPVTERKPKTDDIVIVAIHDDSGDTPYDVTNVGFYLDVFPLGIWVVENERCNYVTHWMPLPSTEEVLTGTDTRGGIRRDDAGNVIDWGITGPPGDVGKTEEGE